MTRARAFATRHCWALGFSAILLAGAVVRIVVLVRANWMLDGDEATMALVGRHIQLRHERPIFFPGQAYMGAWQAYLSAAFFEIFGMSRPVAKLPPLLASVAFIATMMLLARRIYDRNLALLAGAFAALPSIYLLSSLLRLSYPLIDVLALGNLILLIAVDTVWRDDPPQRFVLRALLLGLLAGFGFWLHGAALLFAAPAGLAILLRWPRRALFPGAPPALAGFLLGAAPVFQFARHHSYTTFDYLRGSGSDTAQRDYVEIAKHMVRTIFPRIVGVAEPWGSTSLLVQLAVGIPTVAALLYLAWCLRRAPLAWARLQPHKVHPAALVGLFGLTVIAGYMLSRFSVYAILFPSIDATGRYLAPLASFLPLTFAGAVGLAWQRGSRWRSVAAGGATLILAGTALAWILAPPNQVLQSPYYRRLPTDNQQLIRTLDAMGVDAVWIDHWAGKPLMFDTHERIAATDWVDLRQCNGIDRLGALSARVFASDDPAFVLVSDEERTPLEELFDERGIRYEVARPDGFVVVHPLDGPVDPASVVDALWRAC